MELVLRYGNRTRPILSLPWAIGSIQGALLEQLPPNLFTITRDQVKNSRVIHYSGKAHSRHDIIFIIGRTAQKRQRGNA